MGKQLAKKITWVIKNFPSVQLEKNYSDQFIIGGCRWRLFVYPKGNNANYLFLYLEVADYESLSPGWRRNVRYLLNIVNQNSVQRSKHSEAQKWFDVDSPRWGCLSMFSLNEIHTKDSGFLVNGEIKIVAEIEVLEVIGNLDVSEETSTIMETMDLNGFQLLPSQVEYVSNMFERHPEILFEFPLKNPNLRTGYMSLLLSLIETLRQAPHELSKADLAEAYATLKSMTHVGFQLDWLEKKLVEMSKMKEKQEAGETRMQQIEVELQDLKHKCSDLEAQLEREKAEVLAVKAPLSFNKFNILDFLGTWGFPVLVCLFAVFSSLMLFR